MLATHPTVVLGQATCPNPKQNRVIMKQPRRELSPPGPALSPAQAELLGQQAGHGSLSHAKPHYALNGERGWVTTGDQLKAEWARTLASVFLEVIPRAGRRMYVNVADGTFSIPGNEKQHRVGNKLGDRLLMV